MSEFNYETFEDFSDEWGEPDPWNFAISFSPEDKEFETEMSFQIAQPRKDRMTSVYIKSATKAQIKKYKKQSHEIFLDSMELK